MATMITSRSPWFLRNWIYGPHRRPYSPSPFGPLPSPTDRLICPTFESVPKLAVDRIPIIE
jgi:hypothetical protein